jgi:hypothetical protein
MERMGVMVMAGATMEMEMASLAHSCFRARIRPTTPTWLLLVVFLSSLHTVFFHFEVMSGSFSSRSSKPEVSLRLHFVDSDIEVHTYHV